MNTYATVTAVSISFADVEAACSAFATPPRVVSDITVALDVWNALRANVPMAVDGPPMTVLKVFVDDSLPTGGWHEGQPRRSFF